jgi:hypothetical protein
MLRPQDHRQRARQIDRTFARSARSRLDRRRSRRSAALRGAAPAPPARRACPAGPSCDSPVVARSSKTKRRAATATAPGSGLRLKASRRQSSWPPKRRCLRAPSAPSPAAWRAPIARRRPAANAAASRLPQPRLAAPTCPSGSAPPPTSPRSCGAAWRQQQRQLRSAPGCRRWGPGPGLCMAQRAAAAHKHRPGRRPSSSPGRAPAIGQVPPDGEGDLLFPQLERGDLRAGWGGAGAVRGKPAPVAAPWAGASDGAGGWARASRGGERSQGGQGKWAAGQGRAGARRGGP